MNELGPDDVRPRDTFSLRWRWTAPQWDLLPSAALTQIRPLTEAMARELWNRDVSSSSPSSPSSLLVAIAYKYWPALPAAHEPFISLSRIEAAEPAPPVVAQRLAELVALSAEPVVVVWQPKDAVAVTWEVFCTYWNTCCYLGSDDAGIRPLDERWCLEWPHDEYFLFGCLQPGDGAPMSL